MMGTGHHVTGVAAGLAVAPFVASEPLVQAVIAISAWFGGTAPDWLELPYRKNGGRVSLIPHRRITHWALAWCGLLALGLALQDRHPAYLVVLGFAVGGLAHLAMDIPNPTGVPLLHPWKRTSLHLWKSGRHEGLLMLASLLVAWLAHRVHGEVGLLLG